MTEPAPVITVRPSSEAWELPEGPVPTSTTHHAATSYIEQILTEWVLRTGRRARVVCNLAVKWIEHLPGSGIDPDVCILEPPPPEAHLRSLRTWKPGHVVPPVCFEVVSENNPNKDYGKIQERYAAMGTRELVVFDPLLAGPTTLGGPVLLQLWRCSGPGSLERTYFGDGPAYSEELAAWLHANGDHLRFSDDRDGSRFWLTAEERERAEKERERAEKERERALRQAAELRIAELEARLGERQ